MKKCNILFLLIFCYFGNLQAQSNIAGTITDDKSNPVAGVSVNLLNSNLGTVSGKDGSFLIDKVRPGTYTIAFSGVGFAAKYQEVNTGKQTNPIQVVLEQTSQKLDEIVVTAQKKEELLQRVPISISSLSAKNINEFRLWNTREITGIVPNLYSADPGDKRNVTSIRGITTTSYDPAVATYIDGVNQFSLDTYISPLFDVERIEVLRGPQGTLYGRNAMSGVINIITKQPGNTATGFAEMSLGNYGQQRGSIGVKAPLVKDRIYFGAAALYDGFNGYYINEFNNAGYDKQHSFSGNYYLKIIPADKWVATVNMKHNNNRNNGPFPLVFGVNDAFANPHKLSQNALTEIIDNTFNTSLSINYTGPAFNFNSQTSYQKNYRYYNKPIDADFSPIDAVTLNNDYGKDWNNVKVITQEFKFSSPANNLSKLNWTAGTYFFHQSSPSKTATRYGTDSPLLTGDSSLINASFINTSKATGSGLAVYGQATYALSNKFDLTGGVRFDYEHKKQSVLGQFQQDPNPLPQFDYRSDTSASTNFDAFQPKVSLGYHANKNSLLFLTYSKGYRAGGLTPLTTDPSQPALYAYKPEYSNNIEVGFKNSLVQNKLLLNLSLFYTTVTNAQVQALVLPDAVTITKNTGKLTSKGVEAEIISTPFKGFSVNYSFGYADAKYNKLKVAQNGAEADLKGAHQIFTPDITSMLAAQYSVALTKAQDINLVFRGEWKYLGTQYFDLANTLKQSPYGLLNCRAGISTKTFELMFYGRNLTGKNYISYAYDFGAVHLGDPLTYGATLRVVF